jgi:phospholipid/cholesterol/gamma-HCH transport system substrate-binding protein
MDHRIPSVGAAISLVLALLAVATFVFLNEKFEGPSPLDPLTGEGYELTATFDDTEILPSKQPVLHKGVSVGRVTEVSYDDNGKATVHFTVDETLAPVYEDATARIGERSILGDPFLDLDPGNEGAGEIEAGGEVRSIPSVDFDEALDFLDEEGRADVRSIIDTLGEGSRTPGNAEQLNLTVGGLSRSIAELEELTTALRGQEPQIAAIVEDTGSVLSVLGEREAAIRAIVAGGRSTLDSLAFNTASLDQALVELPRLLESGRATLGEAEPLIGEARPLVADLTELAPDLRPALESARPLASDLTAIIEGLEPQREAMVPVFRRTLKLTRRAQPLVEALAPASLNLVPSVDYLEPRADSVAAFFANASSVADHGDSVGKWARFAFTFEPGEIADSPTPAVCRPEDDLPTNAGFCHNAYPAPLDGLDNEPYEPGSYPRLMPFEPPRP